MSGPAGSAVALWNDLTGVLSGVQEWVDSVCKVVAWPLIQLVDMVDGDPGALRAAAERWDAAAAGLGQLAQEHAARRATEMTSWRSPAAEAYKAQVAAIEQELAEVGEACGSVAAYLRGVAEALQVVHDFLVDLCVEFVNWAIVTLVTALAMAPVTAGASTAAGSAATALRGGKTAAEMVETISKLERPLTRLEKLLTKVARQLDQVEKHLAELSKRQKDLMKGAKSIHKRDAAGKADKWYHRVTDPVRGTVKLGKSGQPFDMGRRDQARTLYRDGLAQGGLNIARNWAEHAPYNLPNAVIHGAVFGTTAMVSGLQAPGYTVVQPAVKQAVSGGADWIDENVFGQPARQSG